jgi:MATE family multidrug resistance protein
VTARGNLVHQLLALAGPALLHGSVVALAFATERLLARPLGSDALAALSIGTVVIWVLTTTVSGVGTTAAVKIGEASGRGDREGARQTLLSALALVLIAWGAIAGVMLVCGPELLSLMFGRTQATREAAAYLNVATLGLGFAFVDSVLAQILFGLGDARSPVRAAAVSGAVTLSTLLLALLVGPSITAFALGASAGTAAGAVCLLGSIFKRNEFARTNTAALQLAQLARESAPTVSEKAVASLGYFVFAALLGRLGSDALAANQALLSIGALGCLLPEAIGIAACSLLSRQRGAGDEDLSLKTMRLALGVSVLLMGLYGAVALALRSALVPAFLAEASAQQLALDGFGVFALTQPFMGIAVVGRAVLRASSKAQQALSVATFGTFAVRLPACLVLVHVHELGLLGGLLSVLADWMVQGVAVLVALSRGTASSRRLVSRHPCRARA